MIGLSMLLAHAGALSLSSLAFQPTPESQAEVRRDRREPRPEGLSRVEARRADPNDRAGVDRRESRPDDGPHHRARRFSNDRDMIEHQPKRTNPRAHRQKVPEGRAFDRPMPVHPRRQTPDAMPREKQIDRPDRAHPADRTDHGIRHPDDARGPRQAMRGGFPPARHGPHVHRRGASRAESQPPRERNVRREPMESRRERMHDRQGPRGPEAPPMKRPHERF